MKEVPVDKRIFRSRTNKTIGGVCGGLGEYFSIDPTFIRLLAVLLVFADGVGLLAYIIAWIIIPQKPLETVGEEVAGETKIEKPPKTEYASWNRYIPGAILICLGVYFVIREHFWWWHMERYWPLLLIVVGVFLIFRFGGRQSKEGRDESSPV